MSVNSRPFSRTEVEDMFKVADRLFGEEENDTSGHMPWKTPSIQTYTGIEFYPLDPRADMITPHDVAHALALKCRYTGHCDFFFSVAQHSVLLSDYTRKLGLDMNHQRWALLHDASEAYLPDVAGPIKSHIQGFTEIEDRLLRAVAERFDLPWPKPAILTRLDRLMYWRERMVLLKDVDWIKVQQERQPVPQDMIESVPIKPWTPEVSEQHFWISFCHLFSDGIGDWELLG